MTARQTPELSVLIATHDRERLLSRCLDSLAAQSADPGHFEVIVAGDGCTDGSEAAVRQRKTPFALRYLHLEKGGQPAALNAAIEVAAGPACLFVDDDVITQPDLVAGHLAAHRRGRVLAIGTIVEEPPQGPDWYARAFARAWDERNAELLARPARWTDAYGANFSARREDLLAVGGFATDLSAAEDYDIAYRLCRAGCQPQHVPEASCVHDDQKHWPRMVSDARTQGAAYVEICRRFPDVEDELLIWKAATSSRELLLRRLLLPVSTASALMVRIGRLLPRARQRRVWQQIIRRLAMWQGVRTRTDPAEWARLTGRRRADAPVFAPPLTAVLADLLPLVPL